MAPGRAEVVELPDPHPDPGEVVVKVMAVTTCPQWDLHLMHGEPMFAGAALAYPYTPGQPGHEMSGVIAAVGRDVDTFKPGDRVVAWRDPGHQRQGCYAEQVRFQPEDLLAIPGDGPFASYAPFELAMCVGASFVDVLGTTSLRGKRVGVAGLGPAGLLAAQFAKAEGASEVIGFETEPGRGEAARSFGVDRSVDPRAVPAGESFRGRFGHLDVSIDCVGSKAAAEYLLRITGEIVAIFGVQREDYAYPAGSNKLFGYPGHTRKAADYAMAKVSAGLVRLDPLIGARMGLDDYLKAVSLLEKREVLKVCFLPHGEHGT